MMEKIDFMLRKAAYAMYVFLFNPGLIVKMFCRNSAVSVKILDEVVIGSLIIFVLIKRGISLLCLLNYLTL